MTEILFNAATRHRKTEKIRDGQQLGQKIKIYVGRRKDRES
jgi:ribosome-associated protein YbcJ (S4-like RNA binding protein)